MPALTDSARTTIQIFVNSLVPLAVAVGWLHPESDQALSAISFSVAAGLNVFFLLFRKGQTAT